jgi:hypothetical protein
VGQVINSGLAAFLLSLHSQGGFAVAIYNGLKGVAYARNVIVRDFLGTDYDNLWFFDSDTEPWVESLDPRILVDVDADIVGGIYPLLRLDPKTMAFQFHYIAGNQKGLPLPMPKSDEMDCYFVGMGCTLIRRHVFEDPTMLLDDLSDPPAFFREVYRSSGDLQVTEDFDFCDRANKAGFTVKAHTGVKFGHVNAVNLQVFHSLVPQMHMKMLDDVGEKPALVMP